MSIEDNIEVHFYGTLWGVCMCACVYVCHPKARSVRTTTKKGMDLIIIQ